MAGNYIDNLLGEREKKIHIARQHWILLFRNIILEIFLIILFLILTTVAVIYISTAFQTTQILIAILVGFIFMMLPVITMTRDVLRWTNHQYIVTNLRVLQLSGIINKHVTDSSLEKVNDVKMDQSVLGRMFNYGDIEILTASEIGVNLFKQIAKPVRFKTAMLNAKDRLERGDEGAGPENITALIDKLNQLRQAGAITEEEFQSKKAELLAKI
jgi:uncharacterized membrane protein YdbT with pleckstrin-like domain